MPRDYKHRARKKKKHKTLSPLAGVIGGLLIGLFVAFLVYLKMQEKPDPHVYLQQSIPAPAATAEQDVRDGRPAHGAGMPGKQQRVDIVQDVAQGQGPACQDDRDQRLAAWPSVCTSREIRCAC